MNYIVKFYKTFIIILIILVSNSRISDAKMYMSISGRIVDIDTMQGLSNAVLDIQGRNALKGFTTKSNNLGYFTIKNLPEGEYAISARTLLRSLPSGYVFADNKFFKKPILLKKGLNIRDLNIFVRKGASISGLIFEEDGVTPLSHIELRYNLYPADYPVNRLVRTDSNGFYRIEGIDSLSPNKFFWK
ncbi:collagen binding domain-containing protein [candidate division CSSED10-310 bacterium]|uniref:Collagen binding domain-containing protein n=1 Tax=candidate division CSSED10-310 bacterium TaxID=2855610 RepID=A0ABV6YRV6_UNCC1